MQNRPKQLVCYICGREYGTHSLAIHIPQCLKKFKNEQSKLPLKERKKTPEPPQKLQEMIINKKQITFDDIQEFNNEAYANYENQMYQCEFCNRTFIHNAYKIHQKSCTKEHPCKKVGQRQTSNEHQERPKSKGKSIDKQSHTFTQGFQSQKNNENKIQQNQKNNFTKKSEEINLNKSIEKKKINRSIEKKISNKSIEINEKNSVNKSGDRKQKEQKKTQNDRYITEQKDELDQQLEKSFKQQQFDEISHTSTQGSIQQNCTIQQNSAQQILNQEFLQQQLKQQNQQFIKQQQQQKQVIQGQTRIYEKPINEIIPKLDNLDKKRNDKKNVRFSDFNKESFLKDLIQFLDNHDYGQNQEQIDQVLQNLEFKKFIKFKIQFNEQI